MSDLKLGHLIEGCAMRDAIHVAVAPVFAETSMNPGQHVGFVEGSTQTVGVCKNPVGVVDPFLTRAVQKGERFWLFLYPNTVTGMRHEWQHPAFESSPMPTSGKDRSVSEQWLRDYAVRMNPYDDAPEKAYARLVKGLRSGEIHAYGSDLHGLHELDDADEVRHHAEIALGLHIYWENFTFTCSC